MSATLIDSTPEFTFVLPAHNEAMNLEPMLTRLLAAGKAIGGSFEIVWVNDGSTDDTEQELQRIASQHSQVHVLHLSRNFGHMAALTAGLEFAHATKAVISLDSDGQHPPELIPELVRRWREGADIVQTIRKQTEDEGRIKRCSSRVFYLLINRMAEINLPAGSADFRLLDRQAVDALNMLPERVRFFRGLVQWIGFRIVTFPYEAPARMGGQTKYSIKKMMLFALSGITSFSVRPLRMTFLLGFVVLVLAMFYAVYVLIAYFTYGHLMTGWTSLLLTTLFLGGIQLLTLGVASEYLGRIYEEAKHRPIYILRKPRD